MSVRPTLSIDFQVFTSTRFWNRWYIGGTLKNQNFSLFLNSVERYEGAFAKVSIVTRLDERLREKCSSECDERHQSNFYNAGWKVNHCFVCESEVFISEIAVSKRWIEKSLSRKESAGAKVWIRKVDKRVSLKKVFEKTQFRNDLKNKEKRVKSPLWKICAFLSSCLSENQSRRAVHFESEFKVFSVELLIVNEQKITSDWWLHSR